ncbi:distal membrane-arm assembly complex protein 2-like [Penaeus japonicus]|uniref:distal membrane-arm assembly complex protein 2-like n=1 Tax=Penaeus japonicus TaxID=27405 RepID=UPI001C70D15F|nr:distal membrane-arm assembly complex protein 2-like [Penaeus japonicus]
MIGRLRLVQCMRVSGSLVPRSLSTTAAVGRGEKEKESWTTAPEKEEAPKGEWKSFFHYFAPERGITIDIVHRLQKGIDLRPKTMQKWLKKARQKREENDQTFRKDRVAALGFDLAAAHFMVHRGGKVRFKGSQEWTQQDENEEYDLPGHYNANLVIEAIDASKTNLLYEGIECLNNLNKLTWLSVANCPHIDDWCIDRICGQYSSSLQHLDISHCTKITHRGIAALARLGELKSLHINGLENINDIKLLCLLLEDILPEIEIVGVDYMDTSSLQKSSFNNEPQL